MHGQSSPDCLPRSVRAYAEYLRSLGLSQAQISWLFDSLPPTETETSEARHVEPHFEFRGAGAQLFQTRDHETILAGPAETGKTFACLAYAHSLLRDNPGAQGVMARKTYASLVGSAVQTYKRLLGDDTPVKAFGGERPSWFDYPNGSRLWLAGLDNPTKALSTERDFIYVNQAEELSLADWETLTTRCTGRGAVIPHPRIFGDCNPDTPHHWIKQRPSIRLLESRHEDNPNLFDEDGHLTAQGRLSLSILDALSGARRDRLRYGRWVTAEGVVYEEWDAAIHHIEPFPIPAEWRRIRSVDFGYSNPFSCGWFAIDPDGRMYLYREIYHTQRLVADHAEQIKRLTAGCAEDHWRWLDAATKRATLVEGERIEATVCDHDAEDRATLDAAGIPTIPAFKGISPGIEAVKARLRVAGDGKPRLFIFKGSLVERDEDLAGKRKPVSSDQEMVSYMWPKAKDGKPVKEVPLDIDNHAQDMIRYAVCYVDGITGPQKMKTAAINPFGLISGTSYSPSRRA